MKKLKVFILKNCPYCVRAISYIDELVRENSAYTGIEVEYIDERKNSAIADKYDYLYVPSFYIEEKKVFEGAIDKDGVRKILDRFI
ncbi:MAG: glutaredoxin [Ruminococcaceae bacterium]|nr:glutaredoxin [Oscillospiraceae bacterium]